ncbi:hypothetical protein WJX77_009750 [Trebouxia sp. C0004]
MLAKVMDVASADECFASFAKQDRASQGGMLAYFQQHIFVMTLAEHPECSLLYMKLLDV